MSLTTAQKILKRLKAAQDGASDYRIAQLLEITPSAISLVKTKGTAFSDQTLVKIAHLLGENPQLFVADYHLATNDFPGMNEFWEELKRLAEKEINEKKQQVA